NPRPTRNKEGAFTRGKPWVRTRPGSTRTHGWKGGGKHPRGYNPAGSLGLTRTEHAGGSSQPRKQPDRRPKTTNPYARSQSADDAGWPHRPSTRSTST